MTVLLKERMQDGLESWHAERAAGLYIDVRSSDPYAYRGVLPWWWSTSGAIFF